MHEITGFYQIAAQEPKQLLRAGISIFNLTLNFEQYRVKYAKNIRNIESTAHLRSCWTWRHMSCFTDFNTGLSLFFLCF